MISLLLLAAAAQPQPSPTRQFYAFGGTQSCASAFRPENAATTRSFVAGIWTGYNAGQAKSVGSATDLDGIVGEVRLVCETAPSKTLLSATFEAYTKVERASGPR